MTQEYEVTAELRTEVGTSASRRIRREQDKIPAVLYGSNKESVALALDHRTIKRKLGNQAFYSHILTLQIDGKPEKAVLKAVHRHPYKPRILHMDFMRVSAQHKLTMHVPLHFIGENKAPGVKIKGGVLSHLETSVEVSCLPADLPEFLEVDVSTLDIDESLHLSQLQLPKGIELVELTHDNDLPIVSIYPPRVTVEETGAPVQIETEVITAKADKKGEADK